MPFWTYMLHCADRSFYIGHTDNLDTRIASHEQGQIPGYTATRLPVKLVWSQDFGTRADALEAERRIKGWSRAKKMALGTLSPASRRAGKAGKGDESPPIWANGVPI